MAFHLTSQCHVDLPDPTLPPNKLGFADALDFEEVFVCFFGMEETGMTETCEQ
jgi:hypothetical protein